MMWQIMHQEGEVMALFIKGNVEVIGHRHWPFSSEELIKSALANIGHMGFARRAAERVIGR